MISLMTNSFKMIMTSSLGKRVATALVLIPLIIIGLFALPMLSFGIITAIIFLLAATEWPKLAGYNSGLAILVYVSLVLILMIAIFMTAYFSNRPSWMMLLFAGITLLIWFLALIWVIQYNQTGQTLCAQSWFYAVWGILIILACWLGLNIIRQVYLGQWLILILLLLVWIADTAAYFAGKNWGRKPLISRVSPKKTQLGLTAALISSVIFAFLVSFALPIHWQHQLGFILLSLVTVIFSVIGDLLISVLKRQRHLKDTGALLPGHGGLLDRIDSLMAATPIFAVGLLILGFQTL